MEVKIGVLHTPREIVLESTQSPTEVEQLVKDAMRGNDATGGVLVLIDEKGRRGIVPSAIVAYVEIAEADHRRVGFAVGG